MQQFLCWLKSLRNFPPTYALRLKYTPRFGNSFSTAAKISIILCLIDWLKLRLVQLFPILGVFKTEFTVNSSIKIILFLLFQKISLLFCQITDTYLAFEKKKIPINLVIHALQTLEAKPAIFLPINITHFCVL